jgi:hypothetical protein
LTFDVIHRFSIAASAVAIDGAIASFVFCGAQRISHFIQVLQNFKKQ